MILVRNQESLIGGAANAIAPQKRILSLMTHTLVEKDNKFRITVATPGASTIITSVLQTILNVHEFDMNIQEAINAPRFHHQWLPDIIMFEPNFFMKETLEELKSKGYTPDEENARVIGKVDGIVVLPNGKLEGGTDKRGNDTANSLNNQQPIRIIAKTKHSK